MSIGPSQPRDPHSKAVPNYSLAVVVVHYGDPETFRPLVESLGRQSRKPDHLIVVDNSPTDLARKVALTCEPIMQVTYLHRPENPGFGVASNLGAEKANSDLLAFINPDVELPEDCIASCVTRYISNGVTGLYSPVLRQVDGRIDRACARNVPQWRAAIQHLLGIDGSDYQIGIEEAERRLVPVGAVNGAFMLTNSKEYEIVGGFDERFWMYAEDLDLCLRYTQSGLPVVVDTATSLIHRKAGTTGGRRGWKLQFQFYKAMVQFWLKYRKSVGQGITPTPSLTGLRTASLGSDPLGGSR